MATVTASQVQELYIGYLGRAADKAGLDFWVNAINTGVSTIESVAKGFTESAEYKAQYTGLTESQLVAKVYQNVLNRAADADGLEFWVKEIQKGAATADTLVAKMMGSLGAIDRLTLDNRVTAANTYTTTAGDKYDVAAGTAAVAVSSASNTFTLTINQDTLVGTTGNDTFNAGAAQDGAGKLINTLQNVDSIDGGAGTDTLSVTLDATAAGAADVVAPTLKNVENVDLRVTKTGSAIDFVGSTGVTKITVANSTADTGTVTNVAAAALAVKNQNAAVTFDKSTATTLELTLDTVGTGGATGTHQVVDLGKTAAAKATTLNITANNANSDITATTAGAVTTVNVVATGVNELDLVDAAGTATTVAITGAGSVDFTANTGTALTAVKTLTVADGGVTVDTTGGALETATTGAGKDTLTVVGSKVKTISTGAGDDKVTAVTDALGATAVVDLGAGNDTLSLAAEPTAGVTLKGGEGTDTLDTTYTIYDGITATTPFSAAQLALITGFETLSLSNVLADATSVDLSKIAGLTSFQTVGVATTKAATVTNVGADAAVIIKGDIDTNNGSLTVTLKDATGSADILNLTLNDLYTENNDATATVEATNAFVVSAAGVETLNVTSTGTASTKFLGATGNKADGVNNTLTLTDTALVTLNVTGDQAITFNTADAQTKLATIDASGNTGGAVISAAATTTATNAALTIKGSATAANTLTGSSNADTIVGGAKADVITGGAGADVLTGGAGNDKFVIAAATDSTLAKTDKITDFVANTYGQGTNNAANADGAKAADSAKWTGDVIDLTAATPTKLELLVVNNAADAQTFIQNSATDVTLAAVNIALDSSTGKLYIDFDNSGTVDTVIELTGVTTITEAAFVIA